MGGIQQQASQKEQDAAGRYERIWAKEMLLFNSLDVRSEAVHQEHSKEMHSYSLALICRDRTSNWKEGTSQKERTGNGYVYSKILETCGKMPPKFVQNSVLFT